MLDLSCRQRDGQYWVVTDRWAVKGPGAQPQQCAASIPPAPWIRVRAALVAQQPAALQGSSLLRPRCTCHACTTQGSAVARVLPLPAGTPTGDAVPCPEFSIHTKPPVPSYLS